MGDVSDLRDDESDGVWQELNLSIAIPHAAIDEPLRELLRCTLAPDPNVRCGIERAARFAERMLAAVKLDADRIFEAQLSKKTSRGHLRQGFCATSASDGSLAY